MNDLEKLRHSTAHVMAQAVTELYPNTKLAIGPPIKDGFYYDFDTEHIFTPDDFAKIEERMQHIIDGDFSFNIRYMKSDEARKYFESAGEKYKVEIIDDLGEEQVSLYKQDTFEDLCKGPHVQSTGKIKAFKLLQIAGAYWRGSEKNKMLQRIYGTAFPSKKELREYLDFLEEVKKRDHRKIGKELDLFSVQEGAGPGLIFWHPKGACIRNLIESFWREEHLKKGYELLYIPHIMKSDLWRTSGHLDFYSENMYSPIDVDEQEYILKPMNCPGHILIYKSRIRSYRELPLRWAELGTVYRYERSGVLHGTLRVRGFTQDDAHIFCTPDQLKDEIAGVVKFAAFMMGTFNFKYNVYLSTRPEKSVGSDDNWETATAALKNALESLQIPYQVDHGEGVFYGPKIDIKMVDALGREWQGPTIQVDFNLPERFNITYVGNDGKDHHAVMVHRTVLGSMERFMGVLTEHYAGAFPVWLSPVQVRVINLSDNELNFSQEIYDTLKKNGVRSDVDFSDEKLGQKIRKAQLEQIPYMLVIGAKEHEQRKVCVRHRRKKELLTIALEEFIEKILLETTNKECN